MATDTTLAQQGVFRRNCILAYLKTVQRERGVMPTRREIAAAVGPHSLRGVQAHLLRLERDGAISLDHLTARSIRVLA